ncbi:MAG: 16S rRNA (adenine(1518)-N(6)/adenine(1519)-N(6))-dimethyltransferase RsmA [Clostridia bacterium]
MSTELTARVALEKYGFRFTHSLGQNFLLNQEVISGIADAAEVAAGESILEIGAGAGILTAEMIARGAHVVAIELDKALEPVLQAVVPGAHILFEDALKVDLADLAQHAFGGAPFRVVANLPYYITADMITRLVTQPTGLTSLTVMVQKEAAERIMAQPGQKNYCALAARVRYFGGARWLLDVPPTAFTPPPHVDSALIRIDRVACETPDRAREDMMQRVITTAFAMRRKTLSNNLTQAFSLSKEKTVSVLESAGLDARVRGEALTIAQLLRVTDCLMELFRSGCV